MTKYLPCERLNKASNKPMDGLQLTKYRLCEGLNKTLNTPMDGLLMLQTILLCILEYGQYFPRQNPLAFLCMVTTSHIKGEIQKHLLLT